MAHEEIRNMSKNTDASVDNGNNEKKSTLEQLADANHEIEDLKLQIAWLERSYEQTFQHLFTFLVPFVSNEVNEQSHKTQQLEKANIVNIFAFFVFE